MREAADDRGTVTAEAGAHPRYVVVTPARNEEAYLPKTIESVIGQTVRPSRWIIVNDGSTDGTREILDAACTEHDWIRAVHRADRGFRAAGSGVMEAFYDGLSILDLDDWDYLVKLDGDLRFGDDYFERCFGKFDAEPELGVGGGVILNWEDGELRVEKVPAFHVRGATKIYRRPCWDAIEGLYRVAGWDTLDEVKANWLGWRTRNFPDVEIVQERFTGDAAGQWSNWVKNGSACYIIGYHPLFALVRALRHITRRPYIVASIGILVGFVGSGLRGVEQPGGRDLIRYLRKQQMAKLLGRETIWK